MALHFKFLVVIFFCVIGGIGITGAARDCSELYGQGINTDGVYSITLQNTGATISVYCEFKEGTGWTRFQRREDGSVNFYRSWSEYKQGFGNPASEHWLGNDYIYHLTNQSTYTLRVDFELWNGTLFYADYSQFKVNGEDDKYRLLVSGYSGTAGDSLWQPPDPSHVHNDRPFATHDRDTNGCSRAYLGGWWYNSCFGANLNGVYWVGGQCSQSGYDKCIQWYYHIGRDTVYRKITMSVKDTNQPPPNTTPASTTVAFSTTAMTAGTTPSPIEISPPTLEIRLEGAFRSVDNTAFPSGCVDAYNIQLESKAKAMVEVVNQEMTSFCSSISDVLLTYEGTQVSTDGSKGRVTLTSNVVGTLDVTVRALTDCSNSITSYLQQHANWDLPLIGDVIGCPSVTFDQNYFNILYLGWACDSSCLLSRRKDG